MSTRSQSTGRPLNTCDHVNGDARAPVHRRRETCRACGSRDLRRFLSLGPTPLANAFLASRAAFPEERSYPLDVYCCQGCFLIQLVDVIDPEVLFRDYIYLTGVSTTMARHHAEYAQTLVGLLHLGEGDLVIEIASNDGSLLQCFKPYRTRILGIEPATNIARVARERGIPTVNEFFDSATAEKIRARHGPACVVIGNNVLAHVDEPQDFLSGCKRLLGDDGLVVVEVPYLLELLERAEYDTIYHEHLCYFSVSTLMRLCEAAGLVVRRVDRVPVHGGSLRLYAGSQERYGDHAVAVLALAAGEREAGILTFERYERFAADVARNRRALRDLLWNLRSDGKTIAAYGAPAKGNTLLNYCGLEVDLIPYTVDKSPMKVGLYTPGTHIPIEPVSALTERRPDYVLILPWNLADEIIEEQQAYRQGGGRFIVPIPEPRVI